MKICLTLPKAYYNMVCDQKLLESYDLDGSAQTFEYSNMLCPVIRHNCCSYFTQLKIYRKWVVGAERKKILHTYKLFEKVYGQIFDLFKGIEKQAQVIMEGTSDNVAGSHCYKISKTIIDYQASSLKKQVLKAAHKALQFIYDSRRGFYCSICDATQQKFYNRQHKTITLSQGFCGQMVTKTMNYYLFRYEHFMKISRLYSTLLTNCDMRGKYYPNNFIPHNIKFFRKKEALMDINNCKASLTTPEALKYCQNFCSYFNPVVYNKYLEGGLDKLFSYVAITQNQSKKMQQKYDKENDAKDKNVLGGRRLSEHKKVKKNLGGRVLADASQLKHPDFDEEGKMNEDINEISQFNKEFKTALIRPITYNFKEDLSIQHIISFTLSLFGTGIDKIYDLATYQSTVKAQGIDFFVYGKSASINKGTAITVFQKSDPANRNLGEADFMKFIMKGNQII